MEDRQTRVLKKLAKVSGIDETKLMEAFSKIDKEEPVEQTVSAEVGKGEDKPTEPNKGEDNKTPNVDDGKAKVDEPQKTENPIPPNVNTEPIANDTPIDGMTKRIANLEEALKASEAKTAQLYEMFNKLDVGDIKPTETTDFDTRKLGGAPIETRKGGNGGNDDDVINKLGGYADR